MLRGRPKTRCEGILGNLLRVVTIGFKKKNYENLLESGRKTTTFELSWRALREPHPLTWVVGEGSSWSTLMRSGTYDCCILWRPLKSTVIFIPVETSHFEFQRWLFWDHIPDFNPVLVSFIAITAIRHCSTISSTARPFFISNPPPPQSLSSVQPGIFHWVTVCRFPQPLWWRESKGRKGRGEWGGTEIDKMWEIEWTRGWGNRGRGQSG